MVETLTSFQENSFYFGFMENIRDNSDDSPQALFVKNIMRKEHPDLNEEQIEQLYQERIKQFREAEGEDACLVCGS